MSSREGEGSNDGDHPKSSKLNVDREEARGCESDREPEEGGEIAEHGQVERGDIPILQRAEIRERGRKQEDDQEQGEIRTQGRGRGGADLELADAHHDSEQAGERRLEPEQVEFVLLVEHATDFSLWIRDPDCLW